MAHPLFEGVSLLNGECVSLGNHWDDVDTVVETLHELDINLTQASKGEEGFGGDSEGVMVICEGVVVICEGMVVIVRV